MKLHPLGVMPLNLDEAYRQYATRARALETLRRAGLMSDARHELELGELRDSLRLAAVSLGFPDLEIRPVGARLARLPDHEDPS